MRHEKSSTILYKNICKKCHSPPFKIKKIGKFYPDSRTIEESIKDSINEHFFYVLGTSVIGDCLQYRQTDRIKMSYINFSIDSFKTTIIQSRKNKINTYKVKNKNVNILMQCKCSKTYWIVPCQDKDFYPELNRRR